jgi:hypothetical protein
MCMSINWFSVCYSVCMAVAYAFVPTCVSMCYFHYAIHKAVSVLSKAVVALGDCSQLSTDATYAAANHLHCSSYYHYMTYSKL